MVPISFMMTKSGTYVPQHLRSWHVAGTMHELNALTRHIEQTAAIKVNPGLIASAAPGMMQVSTESQGNIMIPNGWNQSRGVFILILEVHYQNNAHVRWVVQGYTDEPSFTNTAVAPGLLFYINNIFSMAPRVVRHNGISMTGMSMVDNFQMVNGFSGQGNVPGGNLLIRPQDVMSNISTRELGNFVAGRILDTTVMAASTPQTSRHSNSIGSTMMSNTLNVWHNAAAQEHASATIDTIADAAYANLIEADPSMDVFMNLLTSHNKNLGTASTSFTFRQLQAAMPDIMSIYQPVDATHGQVQFSTSGDSDHLGGQNHATKVAVNLQSLVPAIMVESMLGSVAFSINNELAGGSLDIQLLGIGAFSAETDMFQWEVFKNRFIAEVVPLIVPRGTGLTFRAHISCNFFHEFQLELTVQGQHVRFITPAFCNSLITPVQTASQSHARNFTAEVEMAATHVNDALMESQVRRANHNEVVMSRPGSVQHPFKMVPTTSASSQLNIPNAPVAGGLGALMQAPGPQSPQPHPSAPVPPMHPSAPVAPGNPQPPAAPAGLGGSLSRLMGQ